MGTTSTAVYGIGAPIIYYGGNEDGTGIWKQITLPKWTREEGVKFDDSFTDIDPIDDVMADGTLRHIDRGCRFEAHLLIGPSTKAQYAALRALRGWCKENPNKPFVYRRFSDKQEAYWVFMIGPFLDHWAEGFSAAGYDIEFSIKGKNELDGPQLDALYISHYCDSTAPDYPAGDTGVRCYATTGCPWTFGAFRNSDYPEQFLRKLGTAIVNRYRINYDVHVGMECVNLEYTLLDMTTAADGWIKARVLVHAGDSGGIVWRSNAAMTHHYSLRLNLAADTVTFFHDTTLTQTYASPIALVVDTWYWLKVHYDGQYHSFWIAAYDPAILEPYWYYLGQETSNTHLTGQCGFMAAAGGTIIGTDLDVYGEDLVKADYDTTTADEAACYCEAFKSIIPS